MPIVYALVARDKTVLAEYTATSGNFPTVTRVLLAKIPPQDGRMSYVYDKHIFHYIVENQITYLCMADDELKRRVPFLFLEEMKTRFLAMYGDRGLTAIAFAMNDEFQHVIQQLMDYYNANPEADSLTRVQQQIDDVKDIMVENIEKVLERGEKFELLVDRTDKLNRQSVKFERSGMHLRRSMWRRNVKMWMALVVVGLFSIYLVIAMACGLDFSGCRSSHPSWQIATSLDEPTESHLRVKQEKPSIFETVTDRIIKRVKDSGSDAGDGLRL